MLNKLTNTSTKETVRAVVSHMLLPFDLFHQRNKKNNVAMIHLGRSGSTVLGDLLNQHSKVKWTGEIYGKHIRRDPDNFHRMIQQKQTGFAYEILRKDRRGTVKKIYGYEFKLYHLHFLGEPLDHYVKTVSRYGVEKFIVLERLNYLRVIVSSLVALKTGIWHNKYEKKQPLVQVSVNVKNIWTDGEGKSLLAFLNSYSQSYENARTILTDYPTLELTYEQDILENPMMAYNKVCEFLEIDTETPQSNYWKTNRHRLKDIVVNFEELKDYLKDSEYEWMLYG